MRIMTRRTTTFGQRAMDVPGTIYFGNDVFMTICAQLGHWLGQNKFLREPMTTVTGFATVLEWFVLKTLVQMLFELLVAIHAPALLLLSCGRIYHQKHGRRDRDQSDQFRHAVTTTHDMGAFLPQSSRLGSFF